MSEDRLDSLMQEMVEEIRQLRESVTAIERQITRLGDTGEFFVRRVERSDERLVEEVARQRMGRNRFSE